MIADELSEGLSLLGFRVRTAYAAAEALQVVLREPDIDVVLSDVCLADGNGFDLATTLFERLGAARVPEVILITGHARAGEVTAVAKAAVTELLHKPFRLAEAQAAVSAALVAADQRRRRPAGRRGLAVAVLQEALRRSSAKIRALSARLADAPCLPGDDRHLAQAVWATALGAVAHAAILVAGVEQRARAVPAMVTLCRAIRQLDTTVALFALLRLEHDAAAPQQPGDDLASAFAAALREVTSIARRRRVRLPAITFKAPSGALPGGADRVIAHCLATLIARVGRGEGIVASCTASSQPEERIAWSLTLCAECLGGTARAEPAEEELDGMQAAMFLAAARRGAQRLGGMLIAEPDAAGHALHLQLPSMPPDLF